MQFRRPIHLSLLYGLLGIILPSTFGSVVGNSVQEMCTLQVSSKFSRSKEESPRTVGEPSRTVGSPMFSSSLQTELDSHRSLLNSSEDSRGEEYVLFAHHKSGSTMTLEAASYMMIAIQNLTGPSVDFSRYLGSAKSNEEMLRNDNQPIDENSKTCMLHVSRNPFEVVVSGYLYHMAEGEDWLRQSFGQAFEIYSRTPDGCPPNANWQCYVYGGMVQIIDMSKTPEFAGVLPTPTLEESMPHYLKRVGTDAGLLAEAVWASNYSLASMGFTCKYVKSHPCSVNVCFDEFYENCEKTWKRVLHAWEVQGPHFEQMFEGAMKSCPGISASTGPHTSDANMEKKGLQHPPEATMMSRLRELDEQYLNKSLAELDQLLATCHIDERPCHVGGKYKTGYVANASSVA